jgi:hypothetical protein
MRYYVLGAAALALSGLGEIFLGVNGAPTSLSQARDVCPLESFHTHNVILTCISAAF